MKAYLLTFIRTEHIVVMPLKEQKLARRNRIFLTAKQLKLLSLTEDGYAIPEGTIEIDKGVFMKTGVHIYPLTDPKSSFIPPTGIIKSTEDGDYEYELITDAFVAYAKNENDIYQFELVAGKQKLVTTFLKSIDFLPGVDGFWIYIWNHWDNRQTELWASNNISNKKTSIEFLLKNKLNTLENGYVDCVVHSKIGETNLVLDDHKKIQLYTKDETLFNDFGEKIMNLGFRQTKEFYNLEHGFYHHHYRPASSLNRKDFTKLLMSNNFDLVDSWD